MKTLTAQIGDASAFANYAGVAPVEVASATHATGCHAVVTVN